VKGISDATLRNENGGKYLDLEEHLHSLFPRKVEILTTDGVSKYVLPYISREVVWV
jgi:predicted nucleotidyltransferase